MKMRYQVFPVGSPEKYHPDNRWYVYDYADGAIARLRDGSLAYAKTRALALQIMAALEWEPIWTPAKPTYGSLQEFEKVRANEETCQEGSTMPKEIPTETPCADEVHGMDERDPEVWSDEREGGEA